MTRKRHPLVRPYGRGVGRLCEFVVWYKFKLSFYRIVFNSLAPGRSECDSKNGIFNLVLLIGMFRSSHDNALWWMPHDLTDDKSTLVQVMAWCRQTTSHYLSQCWLSPLSPYGVARPQWVNVVLYSTAICRDSISVFSGPSDTRI